MNNVIRTPWQIQKSVVFALFIRELKTRFGAYKLSYVWMLLEPLVHIAVLSYILSSFGGRLLPGIDFSVFLVTGLIPFFLFRNIALHVMDGVDANRALFSFKQVKPIDAFIARALLESFLTAIVMALLLTGMSLIGLHVAIRDPFLYFALFTVTILMALGLGMLFCVLTYFIKEAKIAIRIAFLPLYFTSGVMFPLSAMPPEFRAILVWNPILQLIELMRGAFFKHYEQAAGISAIFVILFTLAVLFLGMAWYHNRRAALLAS
jgi:capsular polysaccharide transport system permease protein